MMQQEVGILIAILILRGCLIKSPQSIYLPDADITDTVFLPPTIREYQYPQDTETATESI